MEEHILTLSEIEVYVSNLEPSKINELGGLRYTLFNNYYNVRIIIIRIRMYLTI